MMMSLLWFYRPEHTDIGRQDEDCPDEVFASRHRDHTSVACIEDKAYVMTTNEYCRWGPLINILKWSLYEIVLSPNAIDKEPELFIICWFRIGYKD